MTCATDTAGHAELAQAIREFSRQVGRLSAVLEVHTEALPLAEEARILGTTTKRVARMRKARKNERLLGGSR